MVDEQMGMKEEGFPNPSRPERNAAFLPMFRKQGHPAAVLVGIPPHV